MLTLPRSTLATPSWSRNNTKGCQAHPGRSAAGPPKFHTWPFMSTVSDTLPQTPTPGSHDSKAYEAHLATMKEIVSQLRYLPVIEKCLHQYYSFKHNALVPKPVVLQILDTLRTDLVSSGHILGEKGEQVELGDISEISETVLLSSSTEVIITPSLDLHGFCALFCGANLRVETIGLLYTMAARASVFFVDRDEDKDGAFVQDMVWYSTLALRLARDLAPQSTDVIIWLANENAELRSFLEGDASESRHANFVDGGRLIDSRPRCVAFGGRSHNGFIGFGLEQRSDIFPRENSVFPCRMPEEMLCD